MAKVTSAKLKPVLLKDNDETEAEQEPKVGYKKGHCTYYNITSSERVAMGLC